MGQKGAVLAVLSGAAGSDAFLDGSGTVLTMTLAAPLPDADRYLIEVAATVRMTEGLAVEENRQVRPGVLAGDADASGRVTEGDVLAVRQGAGQAVTAATAGCDIDGSGAATGADMIAVRRRLGAALP